MRRLLAALAMVAIGGFAAPAFAQSDRNGAVKVVYRLSDGNAQATNAIRKVIPEATLVPSGVAEVSRLQFKEGFAYLRP